MSVRGAGPIAASGLGAQKAGGKGPKRKIVVLASRNKRRKASAADWAVLANGKKQRYSARDTSSTAVPIQFGLLAARTQY
jgi:hypothetical protein